MTLPKLLILSLSTAMLLAGCHSSPSESQGSTFYYIRSETVYDSDSILVPEERTFQGSLQGLLVQYLSGPFDKNLQSPFPGGTELADCSVTATQANIILSDHASSLTGMDLTVACCALAKTCFSNSDVLTVNISTQSTLLDGQEVISFTENMLYQS